MKLSKAQERLLMLFKNRDAITAYSYCGSTLFKTYRIRTDTLKILVARGLLTVIPNYGVLDIFITPAGLEALAEAGGGREGR